jgi:hypothetical protein
MTRRLFSLNYFSETVTASVFQRSSLLLAKRSLRQKCLAMTSGFLEVQLSIQEFYLDSQAAICYF